MKNTPMKNAIWIVSGKIAQALLGLVVSMLSARYLGPSGYGLINYAASVVAFVVPVMQLGLRSTMVQELIERPDQEGETLGTSLMLNVAASLACIVGVATFVAMANPGETQTLIVCALYSINLVFQALEMIQYWFQAKLLAKYTALASLAAYIVISLYKIYLLISGKRIYWFAVSQAIDYMIIAAALLVIYKHIGGPKMSFSLQRAKEMFSRSRHYIVSGLMVTIFQQTDRLMLKAMLDNSATGYYSAAVACAGISGFVFSAIIDSMRPVILEAKKRDENVYRTQVSRLFSIVFYLSLLQCVFMTVFASPVIRILYGADYAPAIPALQIVVWYITYSYMGSVRNIWILAENKQRYLWIINLSGALLNVVLNAVLIPVWGVTGAAVASFATQIFTNFILGFIIVPIRSCNKLILQGMHPKFAVQLVKHIISVKRS